MSKKAVGRQLVSSVTTIAALPPRTRTQQIFVMLACVLLYAGAAITAWRQPVPPQYEPLLKPKTPSWWLTPLERNGSLRPAAISDPEFLRSMFFLPDSRSGWAVGWEGAILHTEDGGKTWQKQNSGSANLLQSVAFVSAQSGWAVGAEGEILHTEDGGKTWQKNIVPLNGLESVTFGDRKSVV